MSVSVKIFQHIEATIGGELKEIGSRTTPTEITVAGELWETIKLITNAATPNDFQRQLMWEAGDGGIGDFDILACLSDTDVLLELQDDNGDYSTYQLEADVMFVLGSNSKLGAVTVDGTETTLNTIDQIAVQNNNDDTSTATVRLMLFT